MDFFGDLFTSLKEHVSNPSFWDDFFYTVFSLIFTVAVAFLSFIVVRRYFNRKIKSDKIKSKSAVILVKNLFYFVIIFTSLVIILSQLKIFDDLKQTVLTSSGIAVLALSLAAQKTISNVISGVSIALNQSIEVGDFIRIVEKGITGTVTDIKLRYTILKTINNRDLLIPNETLATSIVENFTSNEEVCYFFAVDVAYGSDINKAFRLVKEEILKHPDCYIPKDQIDDYPKIKVVSLNDSSITIRAWLWFKDSSKALNMVFDLNKTVQEAFNANDIEIPYPYTNMIIHDGNKETVSKSMFVEEGD